MVKVKTNVKIGMIIWLKESWNIDLRKFLTNWHLVAPAKRETEFLKFTPKCVRISAPEFFSDSSNCKSYFHSEIKWKFLFYFAFRLSQWELIRHSLQRKLKIFDKMKEFRKSNWDSKTLKNSKTSRKIKSCFKKYRIWIW